jgi:putative membrane protein
VWRRLDALVVLLALYTSIVVLVVGGILGGTSIRLPNWSGASTILNTLVIGLLLGFRTQVAYDRWWEGRKLWGQLINDSRSLCAKASLLPQMQAETRREMGHLVIAFAVALKNQLREQQDPKAPVGGEQEKLSGHQPLAIYSRLLTLLRAERSADRITEFDLLLLDPHVRGLMDVCGGCERIKNTPSPLSYRALLRHGLVLYLVSTPWLVADHLLWWTIPLAALLGYFLLGIELAAEDVEEPFGGDADTLALTAYCETIRVAAEQTLG